jgi:hypothetical protein
MLVGDRKLDNAVALAVLAGLGVTVLIGIGLRRRRRVKSAGVVFRSRSSRDLPVGQALSAGIVLLDASLVLVSGSGTRLIRARVRTSSPR